MPNSGLRCQVSGVRKDRETHEPDDSLQDSSIAEELKFKERGLRFREVGVACLSCT